LEEKGSSRSPVIWVTGDIAKGGPVFRSGECAEPIGENSIADEPADRTAQVRQLHL